jgi:hypothetical protein
VSELRRSARGRRILFLVLATAGCSASRVLPATLTPIAVSQDELAIARLALAFFEGPLRHKSLVLVAEDSTRAFAVMSQLQPVLRTRDLPRSRYYSLPENHLLLRAITVWQDSAAFEGTLGPVPKQGWGCGQRYRLPFARSAGGEWHPANTYSVKMC